MQNSSYPTQPHSIIAKYVSSNCKIAINWGRKVTLFYSRQLNTFFITFLRFFLFVVNDRYRGSKHVHDRKRRTISGYKFMEAALIVPQTFVDKYGEEDFATVLLVIANMVCMIFGDSVPHIWINVSEFFSHSSLRLRVYYIRTAKHLDVTTYSHTFMQTRLSANQSTRAILFILLIRIKPYTPEPLITARVDPRPLCAYWRHLFLTVIGLGQTSKFSWDEPNSNLGWPKLSEDRLLVYFVPCENLCLFRRRSSDALSVWSSRIERVGRSKLIQTKLTEPHVERFMNVTH